MIIDLRNTSMTIEEALFMAHPYDTIILDSKTYNEKIRVTIPNLTLIGNKTIISWDDYNKKIIPESLGGDGVKTYGTTGSTTFLVTEEADNFKAEGIAFINSHDRTRGMNGDQAVAFKSECHNIHLKNCQFKSYQDTLYIDYGINNLIEDCYIEGDLDFIFGSADCKFKNCTIYIKHITGIAYITAPDTLVINDKGFEFENCIFTAEDNVEAYLGRAWFPGGAPQPVYPRLSFDNCLFKGNVIFELIQMHKNDPLNQQSLIMNNCVKE